MVDITDMPGSIHPQLPEIIGDRKPMIVVANKIDLLPPDAEFGYMKRCKQTVERAVAKQGFTERFVKRNGVLYLQADRDDKNVRRGKG